MKQAKNFLPGLMIALLLGACGGGDSSSQNPQTGTTTTLPDDGNGQSTTTNDQTGTSTTDSNGTTGSTTTSTAPIVPTVPATGGSGYGDFTKSDLGKQANTNGAIAFTQDNAWNVPVATMDVDPNSDALIAHIGAFTGIHADFGAPWDASPTFGIPYYIVSGSQLKVNINCTAYCTDSDPGPYPIPNDAQVEGGNAVANDGDRHVLVIDKDNNKLYELYRAFQNSDGSWNADASAIFDLKSKVMRPTAKVGMTSADAAGLPIFPGLVRYEEASKGPGGIKHALRFTVQSSYKGYVFPATHAAGSGTASNMSPMGMRVRLKASFVIPSTYSKESRAILQAMKDYGMILADNGSNWYVSGAPDDRWNNDVISSELGKIKGSDFEVLKMGPITPQGS